ncbi:MAG: RNA polymerase sigma factor [Phycisphaeraceae bacterium]|nr:RNA polymerase sigma factor [Phycisphaeraceae bacterium]
MQNDRLSALVQKERRRLIAIAMRVLHDAHDAEDTVQDTLAAVWRIEQEQPPRRLRPYVHRAVRLNALKRRARRRTLQALTDQAEPVMEQQQSWDIDPLTLERALDGLPATQQAVLRMKYYTGMSFRQIAQTLSISINTAASSARYALKNLRRALAEKHADNRSTRHE